MTDLEWMQMVKGLPCAVVGLGISNLPLIDFLLSSGAHVTARDRKARAELGAVADRLEAAGVRLILGEQYLDDLTEKVIFRSPGLRPDLPAFTAAVQGGALLTSEMELFLELTPATVIGITGSDGKTTTTTLTGLFLESECCRRGKGRVFVGGNIGEPLLPRVREMTADDYAVVELSSFQLQTVTRSPVRAAITNLSPNHLNWHTDMAEYTAAKTNVYRHPENRLLVTNAENEITAALSRDCEQTVTLFSSKRERYGDFAPMLKTGDRAVYVRDGQIYVSDGTTETPMLAVENIRLPGVHNLENYMTAIALTEGLVSPESILEVAKSFTGVRHRLEPVRTLEGVTYYNSSIDSSPSRTAAALSALGERKPIVICGGADKHLSFAPLAEVLCGRAKAVILTGATAEKIRAALDEREEVQNGKLPIYTDPDFRGAVELARRVACHGDVVLLSPACTSFDAFRNFEERGDTFCRIVKDFH